MYRQPRRPPWTRGLEWYPERVQRRDLALFDYVLVNGDGASHARIVAMAPGLHVVTPNGRWRLYRVAPPR